ncbi:hypothetical protein C8R47DRAFT_1076463 [Mycena vitilis]|nr:hypothetical protein C8R47DRAFT_1076463 [Mycena vitilis]
MSLSNVNHFNLGARYPVLVLAPLSARKPVASSGTRPSYMGPLDSDVWLLAAFYFVNDPCASPRETAERRASLAQVCRGWSERVEVSAVLWSSITIVKDIPLSALELSVSRAGNAHLSIRFSLFDVHRFYGRPRTLVAACDWVDSILDVIGHTSDRWTSFQLDTEDPRIFSRIHARCRELSAPLLSSLDLSYTHLPGIFAPLGEQRDLQPFCAASWFDSGLPCLARLSTFCVPMSWDVAQDFSMLGFVEFSDFNAATPMSAAFLPVLFGVANQMRILKLGAMESFTVPPYFSLPSVSLEALDIDFDSGPVTSAIIGALIVPNLIDLTVRNVGRCIEWLLQCPYLLLPLTRLCVHYDIGDPLSLQHLFNSMPHLAFLDLAHSRPHVFHVYCQWADSCARLGHLTFFTNLRVLHLPAVDLSYVVSLVNLVGELVGPRLGRVGVERLRVDSSWSRAPAGDDVFWLNTVVSDFAFTSLHAPPGSDYRAYYSPSGSTSRLAKTAHSLLYWAPAQIAPLAR